MWWQLRSDSPSLRRKVLRMRSITSICSCPPNRAEMWFPRSTGFRVDAVMGGSRRGNGRDWGSGWRRPLTMCLPPLWSAFLDPPIVAVIDFVQCYLGPLRCWFGLCFTESAQRCFMVMVAVCCNPRVWFCRWRSIASVMRLFHAKATGELKSE